MDIDTKSRNLKGFERVKQVYSELYRHLGEEYSAEELLRAAQILIDVTRDEYVSDGFEDGQSHSGYFSRATDSMIRYNSWLILENECKLYSIPVDWEAI